MRVSMVLTLCHLTYKLLEAVSLHLFIEHNSSFTLAWFFMLSLLSNLTEVLLSLTVHWNVSPPLSLGENRDSV